MTNETTDAERHKVFKFRADGLKCSGCNYQVTNHWVAAPDEETAQARYEEWKKETFDGTGGGLCGDCLLDIMANHDIEVDPF